MTCIKPMEVSTTIREKNRLRLPADSTSRSVTPLQPRADRPSPPAVAPEAAGQRDHLPVAGSQGELIPVDDADSGLPVIRTSHSRLSGQGRIKTDKQGKKPRVQRGSQAGGSQRNTLKPLLVARDGIEPPTRGFSVPCSTN